MLVVCRGTPLVGTGPYNKGGELLKPPILTTPQGYNAWSPPGGGIELEGVSKFTIHSTGLPVLDIDTKHYFVLTWSCVIT